MTTLLFGLRSNAARVIVRAAESQVAPPVPGTTAPSASGRLPGATSIGVRPAGTTSTTVVSCAIETRVAFELVVVSV